MSTPELEIHDDVFDIDSYFYDDNNANASNINIIDDVNNNVDNSVNDNKNIIVGIDLGTSNSCVGIWRNNNLEIIKDMYGNDTIPSVVAFTNKSKYIGKMAKNQMELNPTNSFYELKRLLGKKYDDESIKNNKDFLTYKIGKDDNNNIVIKSNLSERKAEYTPEELVAMILMELKYNAERYLGCPVIQAVISVPAYYNDSQRQATKDAAQIAGLECERIIHEPTAAALAYGLYNKSLNEASDLHIVVIDIGGGTTDVSLLNLSKGYFQVLASTGNSHLGGVDFDNRLISYCFNMFKNKHKLKLENVSAISVQRLRKLCEEAKKTLSTTWRTMIAIKNFYLDKNLKVVITKEKFEELCNDLFVLCLKPVEDLIQSCDIDREDIDEIILVGGMTRVPKIRENIQRYFNKKPNTSINPDIVVAAGAAIQGYMLANKSDPFSKDFVLLDIVPLSLGVETIGGVMNTIIPRNSVIPMTRSKKFTSDADYETSIEIKIYEGERTMTKNNYFVGKFLLEGLESAPRGISKINVEFHIDICGIINVTAQDVDNKDNNNQITITGNKGRLSPEKIKKLIEEAQEMEIVDKQERELKYYYYEIDDLCSNIKMNLNSGEIHLSQDDKQNVLDNIQKYHKWLMNTHYMDIKKEKYLTVIHSLRKKYGTLVLKSHNELSNVKGVGGSSNISATSIYNDENDDDDEVYELLEDKELGVNDMDAETKRELKELRLSLIEMCKTTYEIISNIDVDKKDDIINYVNDTLLWIYVQENIVKIEYEKKINDLTNMCNELISKYPNLFDTYDHYSRNELENLCLTLKCKTLYNPYSVCEEDINKIISKANDYLVWLTDLDVAAKKSEIDGTVFEIDDSMYADKINELNNLCNNLLTTLINN